MIRADYRSGILADLLHLISRRGFTVTNAGAKLFKDGDSECSFEIVPRNPFEVAELLEGIRKIRSVRKIYFE